MTGLTGIAGIASTPVMQVLPLAMDAASLRQQVAASNIANASNPAWKPLALSFEDRLQAVLARGAPTPVALQSALQSAQPRLQQAAGGVAVDEQVLQLSRTVLHYQALSKSVSAELELLSLAASDGRR